MFNFSVFIWLLRYEYINIESILISLLDYLGDLLIIYDRILITWFK